MFYSKLLFLIGGLFYYIFYFYQSFVYASEIKLAFYVLSPFEFLVSFFIFLVILLCLYTKGIKDLVYKSRYKILFFTLLLFVLIFLNQMVVTCGLCFIFLISLFDFKVEFFKKVTLSLYFVFVNYILILMFSSGYYLLYFLFLFLVLYLFFKKEYKADIYAFVVIFIAFELFLKYADLILYDVFIWLDFPHVINYMQDSILYLLTFIHIIILFFLRYNQRKLLLG